MNRRSVLFTFLALASGAMPVHAQVTTAEVKTTFADRCIKCHQPPDPNLASDRAWLDQLHRTG